MSKQPQHIDKIINYNFRFRETFEYKALLRYNKTKTIHIF